MAKSKKLSISSIVGCLAGLVVLLSLIGLAFAAVNVSAIGGFLEDDSLLLYSLVFGLDDVEMNYYLLTAFILVVVGGLLLFIKSKIIRFLGSLCGIAGGVIFFLTCQVIDFGVFGKICEVDIQGETLCSITLGLGTILSGCLACGGGVLGLVSCFAK